MLEQESFGWMEKQLQQHGPKTVDLMFVFCFFFEAFFLDLTPRFSLNLQQLKGKYAGEYKLLNLMYAREGTPLHSLATVLSRLDNISSICAWTSISEVFFFPQHIYYLVY